MRKRDLHQPRTFFFRPNETVTIKVEKKSRTCTVSLRPRYGDSLVRKSGEKIMLHMPKDSLQVAVAEMDVNFGGRWDRLHLDHVGIVVSVRGSKGVGYRHHIVPGPKVSRWTYRFISAEPGDKLYFCAKSDCSRRMMPVMGGVGKGVCSLCGGTQMIPVEVPAPRSAK